ncbi:hypothetical protein F2Q68_00035648 [Brassica cretica]|uniref:Uncharacterized protein n=1 Tax=Brassica cretica TaxID=69181 RepID=A0A8S9H4X1_BRACR|nr:hypothetical protein F2Q68_00035648 [Brassica cretica]
MEFFEEVGSSGNIFPQDVVASSWEYVCQGKHMVLQYMKPVHASRHVEHEVDRPSTRCCDACDQTMRLDMWRTWCLLAWSQAMHPDRIPLLGGWIMAGGRLANAECLDDIAKLWIARCSGSGRAACSNCGGTGTGTPLPVRITVQPPNRPF